MATDDGHDGGAMDDGHDGGAADDGHDEEQAVATDDAHMRKRRK